MTFTHPLGPFSILYEPRRPVATPALKKPNIKRTKLEQSVIALETPQERALRRILRKNKNTHVPTTQADRDRNAVIAGKGVHLSSNP